MSFKKTIIKKNLNIIMLRFILKNISKYVTIFFQIVFLVSKLLLNNGYKYLKM
jgi:hypothetical protein